MCVPYKSIPIASPRKVPLEFETVGDKLEEEEPEKKKQEEEREKMEEQPGEKGPENWENQKQSILAALLAHDCI